MDLHSALCKWVEGCLWAGTAPFNPYSDFCYLELFKRCTAGCGLQRTIMASQLTRDAHFKLCSNLMASGGSQAARSCTLLTRGISTMLHCDGIRDWQICTMHLRPMDSIGPAPCYPHHVGVGDCKVDNGLPDQKACKSLCVQCIWAAAPMTLLA